MGVKPPRTWAGSQVLTTMLLDMARLICNNSVSLAEVWQSMVNRGLSRLTAGVNLHLCGLSSPPVLEYWRHCRSRGQAVVAVASAMAGRRSPDPRVTAPGDKAFSQGLCL